MNDLQKRHQKSALPSSTWPIIFFLIVLTACHKNQNPAGAGAGGTGRGGTPPVPVVAGTVIEKDVPVYLDGLGTVQAFNTVTVHVRVDGQLKKVAFTEGQDVHAGDLLAQIDPDPFKAMLDQAIAKKGQDEAQLINSQRDLKREVDLFAAKIDSQQVYDTQKALVDQLQAAVNADQAAIASAQVQLDYTSIYSPIEGRTGIRQVDQGNIVHATDANGLVVITQLKPITVIFTLPEQNLTEIHNQQTTNTNGFRIFAVGSDGSTPIDQGTLAVIDNQIDSTTGTIRLKATFPNEHLNLWPGQFVNVRLLLTVRHGGLVVPASTIQRGPDGAYVFVIENGAPGGTNLIIKENSDVATKNIASGKSSDAEPGVAKRSGKKGTNSPAGRGSGDNSPPLMVRIRPVKSAPQVEAGQVLIESGLQKGERVVVDGQYKLQDGSSVRINNGTNSETAGAPTLDATQ